MSTQTETAERHVHAGEHDHGGPALYGKILGALLVLTAITVAAAYVDLGSGNVVVALTIATIKAMLVALFFMHLRWDKPVNAVIAMAGFLFLGIFLMFCLLDFSSRNNYLPANFKGPVADMPLAPGTAPRGEVIRANPAAAAEGASQPEGEKK